MFFQYILDVHIVFIENYSDECIQIILLHIL